MTDTHINCNEMESNPSLLFISPILPRNSGNGLAMRCGTWIRNLSADYRVSVLVVPISELPGARYDGRFDTYIEELKIIPSNLLQRSLSKATTLLPSPFPKEWRKPSRAMGKQIQSLFNSKNFDSVFVFRLYMASYLTSLELYCEETFNTTLDIDDIESETRSEIAKLQRSNGEKALASHTRKESILYENLERSELPKFDTVYVCSNQDQQVLIKRYQHHDVRVTPNTIRMPAKVERQIENYPFTFLFIGNLRYYPNRDAVEFFAREILPIISENTTREVCFKIIGDPGTWGLNSKLKNQQVQFLGPVKDLSSHYKTAGAVVVPLRAGGGTRIKILEACSYKVPIISTKIGVSGIPLLDGDEIFIADSAEIFARKCLSMLKSENMAENMATRAYACVKENYSEQKLAI